MSRLSGFEGTSSSHGKELSKMLELPGESRIQTGTLARLGVQWSAD